MDLSFRAEYPLKWPDGWPRTPERKRRDDAFGCTPGRALDDLERDLRLLGCSVATMSSWLSVGARGMHVAMARNKLGDPGVSLTFLRHGREYVMARDAFLTPFGNLRSIGLAINCLRGLERHGGTGIMDRAFAGFQALPPPNGHAAPPPPMDRPWRDVLGLSGFDGPSFAVLAGAEAAYRTLAKKAHPDSGGTANDMAVLNRAIAEARDELK